MQSTYFGELVFNPDQVWLRGPAPEVSDASLEQLPGPPGFPNLSFDHPPLYYAVGGLLYPAVDDFAANDMVLVYRLLSALMVLLVPIVTIATLRELVPKVPSVVAIGAAFIALFPMLAQQGVSINNDALAIITGSLFIYLSVRIVKRGVSPAASLGIGMVVALGLLTKGSALVAAGFLPLVLFWPAARDAGERRRAGADRWWRPFVWAGGGLAVGWGIGATWWIPTLIEQGSLVPAPLVQPLASAQGPFNHAGFFTFLDAGGARLFMESFWGNFGWLTVRLPDGVYLVLNCLGAAALVGLIVMAVRAFSARRNATDVRRVVDAGVITLVLAGSVLIPLAGTLKTGWEEYMRTGLFPGLYGRYLLPAAPALAAGFALGLTALVPRRLLTGVVFVLGLGMVALDVDALTEIARHFYLIPGEGLFSSLGDAAERYSFLAAPPHPVRFAAVLMLAYLVVLGGVGRSAIRYLRARASAQR